MGDIAPRRVVDGGEEVQEAKRRPLRAYALEQVRVRVRIRFTLTPNPNSNPNPNPTWSSSFCTSVRKSAAESNALKTSGSMVVAIASST